MGNTNGYPCPPYWSPAYSYGTMYGTGLYNAMAYSAVPPAVYSGIIPSRVVTPTLAPAFVNPPALSSSFVSRVITPPIPQTITPMPIYSAPLSVPPQIPITISPPPLAATISPYASVATVPAISAMTPVITPPLSSPIVAPTNIFGGGGFSSGGFNLFGDVDPITPGIQSTPGVVTATGPTSIF